MPLCETKDRHAASCSGRLLSGDRMLFMGTWIRWWLCSYCNTVVIGLDDATV